MTDLQGESTGLITVIRSRIFRAVCMVLLVLITAMRLVTMGSAADVEEFPVSVRCEGETKVHMVSANTVKEALDQAGYTVGISNIVRPEPSSKVRDGDLITILGMGDTYTVEEELPYETYTTYSPDVKAGKTEVTVQGEIGLASKTYTLVYENGVEEEVLLDETIVREPTHQQQVSGFPSQPVSTLDFGYTFDENFAPVGHQGVLRGQRAAGYNAPAGAKTASGMDAVVGHVAVNPNVIPYGTKLFIASEDGRFIYGYAIAADTGSSLMQGVIDVDLFYDTYEGSARNGMKNVNIYILS